MDETVIVALLSLAGTMAGSLGGILTANRLTNYRIEQLEQKVAAHNNLVARTYHLEAEDELHNEQIKVINHRLEDLEKNHIA